MVRAQGAIHRVKKAWCNYIMLNQSEDITMLRKYGFKIVMIFSILLLSAVFAYTHSGRTDKYGGHHDRINGGYHYHNSGTFGTTPTIPNWTPSDKDFYVPIQSGADLYFPTKLEWLALQLNARYNTGSHQLVGIFQENEGKNTITIEITYMPDSSVEARNETVELMKRAVKIEAMRYGWQDWVKVDIKMERLSY